MKKYFLLLALTILVVNNYAQETTTSLNEGSIEQQFEFLNKKSSNWQIYKTVKKVDLIKIRANVKDSISALKNKLAQANGTISTKDNEYKSLQGKLDETKIELNEVTESKDSISLLGISLSKGTFKTIFWSIITLLSLVLAYFVYSFKNSNKVTKATLSDLAELEEEFNASKTRALEREQVLNRKLLDEVNKNK